MKIENPDNLKQYHKSPHLIYSCQYHIVFCPKYRRKVLSDEISVRMKEIFYEVANKYKFNIIEVEIMPDHVHLLIDCNPRFGITECVKKIKNYSAKIIRDEFPYLKSRLPSMWTRSTFITTVGAVTLDVVKKYIEDQKGK